MIPKKSQTRSTESQSRTFPYEHLNNKTYTDTSLFAVRTTEF